MSSQERPEIKHVHKVLGDGNCLLRAVGLQVDKSHQELRDLLYTEYTTMREHYANFFEDIDAYAEKIKHGHVWCDETDIAALANIVAADIHLYINNINTLAGVYPCRQETGDVVGIVYVNCNHYDAVIKGWYWCDELVCDEYAEGTCDKCDKNYCDICQATHTCIAKKTVRRGKTIAEEMTEERMAMIHAEEDNIFWGRSKIETESKQEYRRKMCAHCTDEGDWHCSPCGARLCDSCKLFHCC